MLTDAKRAEISARVAARLARAGLRPPLKPKLVVDNPVVRASTDDHNRAGATRIRSVESLRRHEPQVMRNPYALDGVASGRAFGQSGKPRLMRSSPNMPARTGRRNTK
jgi:hypothetical protein